MLKIAYGSKICPKKLAYIIEIYYLCTVKQLKTITTMATINNIKQFEIGRKYSMRSVCNNDCVWTYKVIGRTACTVTLVDNHGKFTTCRINKKVTIWNNAETVYPLGKYSMSPMLCAE